VLFLHGLTFDRTTWRPIIERLGGGVQSIAVDLPAHGESGGRPALLEDVATELHGLMTGLDIERPVVVGHSMSGAIALMYAGTFPAHGVVVVDQGVDIRGFGALVKQLEPALRSPGFGSVFARFQESMGIDLLPEPQRSLVLGAQRIEQDVIVGYWEQVMRADLEELQAQIDEQARSLPVPCLGVFGHAVSPSDRATFALAVDVEIDEHPGEGHFVHLMDPDRFAARLRAFVDRCQGREAA
jgi:pimeloyl-ACP methyl ester carboxylesterase